MAGLRIDEDRLGALVRGLSTPLGIAPDDANVDARKFALDADNLATLYRHALLCRSLGLSADELFRLCSLSPDLAQDWVAGLADVVNLVAFWAWWAETDWSIDEIETIVGVGPPPTDFDPATIAASVVSQVESQGALLFAPTFTPASGSKTAGSRDDRKNTFDTLTRPR